MRNISKQQKALQYLSEMVNLNAGVAEPISALNLKLTDYLNNYSLNQAAIQCEFEHAPDDTIIVHPLIFDETVWETQGYFVNSSNWLRDSVVEKKDILTKVYETCLETGLVAADYRGIVLLLSALKGDDEGGKADLQSETGKMAMVFFNNLQDWATYAHEIGHVLGLGHSFYANENTSLIDLIRSIKRETDFQNTNQDYITKRQLELDKNLLSEEDKKRLEDAKQAQIESIARLKRFYFSKNIYEINKFRFAKQKTTNLMDYSRNRNSFFYYQWQIMQNEIIQYYGNKE